MYDKWCIQINNDQEEPPPHTHTLIKIITISLQQRVYSIQKLKVANSFKN